MNIPDRFESERLVLRSYQAGDGPLYFAAGQRNRRHLQQYESGNAILTPTTEAEAENLVQQLADDWRERRSFFLGAFEKATGAFAAQIYVGVVNWELPEFEVGYMADVDHEGQGLVSEALRATLGFIFIHLQAARVRLYCEENNLRSMSVALRCGFRREGLLRQERRDPSGVLHNSHIFALLRSEYEAQPGKLPGKLPAVHPRLFAGEADFWKVRSFLVETYPLTPPCHNWEIRRWDGWFFHRETPAFASPVMPKICLWEDEQAQLVGVVHPEGQGDANLEVHPDYRHLEAEMLAWAESHLAAPAEPGGAPILTLFVYDYDVLRRRLVEKRGYQQTGETAVTRRLRLGKAQLPPLELAAGYLIRTTQAGDDTDYQRMADLLNAAFGRSMHSAPEYRTFVTGSPSFRHDLNLVAQAQDGSFAAHVGLTFDVRNQMAVFEPVCTHPDHRRKSLARSLMLEGLRRLQALGAVEGIVGTGDMLPANELYDALGFSEMYMGAVWQKAV